MNGDNFLVRSAIKRNLRSLLSLQPSQPLPGILDFGEAGVEVLQSEFLPQFLINFSSRLPVDALAVVGSFRSGARGTHLNAHDIA